MSHWEQWNFIGLGYFSPSLLVDLSTKGKASSADSEASNGVSGQIASMIV